MTTIYMKVTCPELPECVRTSINSCMEFGTPEKTLAKVRREAIKRGVTATYELATREEYLAFRADRKAKTAELNNISSLPGSAV